MSAMELYSVQIGKRGQIQTLSTQRPESAPETPLVAFPCRYAILLLKPPHRRCASSSRSAWAFLGLSELEREYGFRWAL